MKMKRMVMVVVVLLAAVVLLSNILVRLSAAGRHGVIRLSGNIEVTDAQVSFKMPGRVLTRLVSEGEGVTNGQIVALLDNTELEQEAAMRLAEEQAARAVLSELEAGTRPEEIEQAAAALDVANAEETRVKSEFARQEELFGKKVISQREFEVTEAAYGAASARVREADARLTLLRKGPREETINGARSRMEQARQAVALAKTHLDNATLRSPLDGIVFSEGIESGEYVVPGTPVVTVGDLTHVWLRAYINETDLGRIKIGQTIKVSTDTYPGKIYTGRLSFIASQAEFTPKSVQTAKERVTLVYRIKADIANPDQELKPGMPADGEIGW